MARLSDIRDPHCTLCRLSDDIESPRHICMIPRVTSRPDVLIVTRNPPSEKLRGSLRALIHRATGGESSDWLLTGAIKCQNWDYDPSRGELLLCARTFLDREIHLLKPRLIVTLGNEALLAVTGKTGVMKYRGQSLTHKASGIPVYPTISPSMVTRNPGLEKGFIADLRNSLSETASKSAADRFSVVPRVVRTKDDLKALRSALRASYGIAYDIETSTFDEYRPDSRMVSIAFTLWDEGDTSPREGWAVPLCHPESQFKSSWVKILRWLLSGVSPRESVAHNGKFDCRWINYFLGRQWPQTFDTMIALHLLDEAQPKGLKPAAQAILGVAPWAVDTGALDTMPLVEVLEYNALDTWYTAHLFFALKKQLDKEPRLATLMSSIMMPASEAFTKIESRGIWLDRELLLKRQAEAEKTLSDIDSELLSMVPEDKRSGANFNPSKFARWWLFEHLQMPVLARGKAKPNGAPGDPSMSESVLQKLQAENPHRALDLLLQRTKWQKYTSAFFRSYVEQIDSADRIHTTFKLTGTVTGRLSSGKGDSDKVTGRVQNRGVNLQQVPRDSFVRGLFGAPPGSVFVECDYSQIELRVAAFLARESTMLGLYNSGQDIHHSMAQKMTGKPEVSKEERTQAKAVNFGFLYGMNSTTFIETAWANYGVKVTPEQAEAFRAAFFTSFPKLQEWHSKQRKMVAKYRRVESPLGRIRHLPDIDSPDPKVKAEAQRQAINSPVQSFASDMCIYSLVLLDRLLSKRGFSAHPVGTVHDSINLEIPIIEVPLVIPLIRYVMENLPLKSKFGVSLSVPIVADVKIGTRWGSAEEVPADISSSPDKLRLWLSERGLHATVRT